MIVLANAGGQGKGYRVGRGSAFRNGNGIDHNRTRRNWYSNDVLEIGSGCGYDYGYPNGKGYGYGVAFDPVEKYPFHLIIRTAHD